MSINIETYAQRTAELSYFEQGDYFADDGLLMCHKCDTPKQCRINIFGTERIVPCLCKCAAEERDAAQRRREHEEFLLRCEKYRRLGFADDRMRNWTFANDDGGNPTLTQAMQNYVAHFDDLKAQGKGLLLYGSVGSGKTFAACEVAHALIDKGHPALVTNFIKLVNVMQEQFNTRQTYIDSLNKFSLLVLDDLDAERATDYMLENVYNIIDSRYRAGLPMIVTTNLSGSELKNPDNISKERIYSRLLERCHPIEVNAKDRRKAALKDSYASMRHILGV